MKLTNNIHNHLKTIYCLLILHLVVLGPIYPQAGNNIRFERISLEQGLSQGTVNCIMQDKQGFIWLGTQDGLNKFDGHQFSIYRHDPQNDATLSDNYIWAICEDSRGNLWIGTQGGGLNKFNRKSETFTRYQHQPDFPQSLRHNSIRDIFEDSRGILWIGTAGGGLNKFQRETETFTHYINHPDNPNSLSHNYILSIFEDSAKNLWIGTSGGGLNKFDLKTETFTCYKHQVDNPASISHNTIWSICEDSEGCLWIGTLGGGLNKFDQQTETFTRYQHQADNPKSLSNNTLWSVYRDSGDTLWIGTLRGLNEFNTKEEVFTSYQNQANNPHSLSNSTVRFIFEDLAGNLWIGTQGGGVNKFNRHSKSFNLFQHQADNPNSLSNNSVWSIFEDSQENLWIATQGGGLNKLDRKTGSFTSFNHQADDPQGISHNYIWTIYGDSGDNLWIGTAGGGLNKFNRKSETFTHYLNKVNNPKSLSHNNVYSIAGSKNAKSTLWVGTLGGGLNKFDQKSETFTHFKHQANNPKSLSHNNVFSIVEDFQGSLWIGTENGLNKFDQNTNIFFRYYNQVDNPKSLSHNCIYAIFEDSKHNLWFGTHGGGLNRFDRKLETFHSYREKDGLPNDVVYGILEDEKGCLWMSTNDGISRLNPETKTFTNYDQKDGLQSNEFNSGAHYKDRSGRLYFGGINGFNAFHPRQIKDNTYIPPVVITNFLLFNKPVEVLKTGIESDKYQLPQHINFTQDITFDYTDYIFAFEFSALNYRQSEKNQYAYKLEGFNENWIETDYKNRRATYTNIPHGTYTFRVKASNDDGYWNEKGASIKLTILPPPWKTWWAYTLYTLALLGLIFWFIQSQRKKVRGKQKELDREKEFSTRLEHKVQERTAQLQEKTTQLSEVNKELEKLSVVASETDNAVLIMDSMGTIEWINEGFTRIYGFTQDEYLKHRGNNILTTSTNPNIEQDLEKCIEGKKTVVYDSSNKTKDGQVIWTQTTLTPILDENGNIKKLIAIESDITKIKEAEEAAEQANQSKSEFLARMSHEIRTPMNGVIGFTDMLLDTELSDEQVDYARTISRSGETLINILNDILDFSKIEAGELTFDSIDFDPEITVFDVCELIMPRLGTKQVEVLCRVGDHVPALVYADPGRFRQVVVNLMGNASKFTETGEIELSLDVEKETQDQVMLHIQVRDTGIGIPQDKVATIFDAFHQADGSTTRKYGGTGLGLAICKQISSRMGGDVWVESEDGKGSTFHFTAWVGRSKRAAAKEFVQERLKDKKVLIVDDNATNLEILSHTLVLSNMRVVTVADAKKAISVIADHFGDNDPFDLCIIDIQMPEFSGYDLAKEIRKVDQPMSKIPLLAFSSSTVCRSRTFKDAGFDGFLPKPVQRKKLLAMIERLLGLESVKEEDRKEEMVTQHTIIEEAKHSIRILLAEDNAINMKLARHMLEKAGYTVMAARDGQEAVDMFTAEPEKYDLILMDIQMPILDGKKATRIIREKGFKDIPIIAMTAEAMKGDQEKCIEAGMNDYIPKPMKREVVFKIIRKWCLENV